MNRLIPIIAVLCVASLTLGCIDTVSVDPENGSVKIDAKMSPDINNSSVDFKLENHETDRISNVSYENDTIEQNERVEPIPLEFARSKVSDFEHGERGDNATIVNETLQVVTNETE